MMSLALRLLLAWFQLFPFPGPGSYPNGVSYTSFITGSSGASPRNNFDSYLGMQFTLTSAITIHQIGRLCLTGNSGSHDLYIFDTVPTALIGPVTVNMSGCSVGTFVYGSGTASLGTGNYFCISGETNGGDTWNDDSYTPTTTGVGFDNYSAYTNTAPPSAPSGFNINSALKSYVPCNFKY